MRYRLCFRDIESLDGPGSDLRGGGCWPVEALLLNQTIVTVEAIVCRCAI